MIFRDLELTDKPSFDRILRQLQPQISDLTFTNLWMWRHVYGLQVAYLAELDFWLLCAKPSQWPCFFLPPVGDWNDPLKLAQVWQIMQAKAAADGLELRARRFPGELVQPLLRLQPDLQFEPDRNTCDYLYSSADLINLAGRNLHSKKNLFNQFQRRYQWRYQPLDQAGVAQLLELQDDWLNLHPQPGQPLGMEEQAMRTVLEQFAALQVVGGAIWIGPRIEAWAVGEPLNQSTAVIHIEKANTNYTGIYATINQQFVAHHWAGYELVNREEDMGLAGLRQAKLAYRPLRLVEKFNLNFKN